ncbi:MAG: hypothetical protein ACF8LK_04615 [Phycisphaerales bacterium JB041]
MSTHHDAHTESQHSELDAWHQHPAAEGMPQAEHGAHAKFSVLLITFVVITVATVAFSVLIGVYSLGQMDRLVAEREAEGLEAVAPEAAAYKHAALAAQSGYGWTEEGNVKLPIEQAMELIVREQGETPNP